MSNRWKKIDADQSIPIYLTADDQCYYARDYIAQGSWTASPGNNLIKNFKKDVSRRNKPEWRYKLEAIDRFARDLRVLILDGVTVAAIPSSKARSDPEYDSRMEDMLMVLKLLHPTLRIVEPFLAKTTLQAAHLGGPRTPELIYRNLEWVELGEPIETKQIVLIDDVITTGAHFKACQRLLQENVARIEVFGVFWAKTVWQSDDAQS
jgi:hypothetical protein